MAFKPSYNIMDRDTHNALVNAFKTGGIGYTDDDGTVHKLADDYVSGGGGGGSSLPPVTSADEGKVLAVNASGEWAANDMFIFIDNDDDMETLGVTPRQVFSAIENHKIILVCSVGTIYAVTQVIDGQWVDPDYTGKYVTVIIAPNGRMENGLPIIVGNRYIADTLDDIFTFD